ncbi:MAG: hypothetical protein IJ694_02505 [Acidaminococcaceae bacterium]|nr:hypothetical protein [Acidaminococcaceae bacterium]
MSIKKMFFLVASMVMMVTSSCFAHQVTLKDLNIGGIYVGQPMREVASIYKNPAGKIDIPPKGFGYIFIFDENVGMKIQPSSSDLEISTVEKITVDGLRNNNLVMNSGIGLGSTLDDVLNTYGKPDESFEGSSYAFIVKSFKTGNYERVSLKHIEYSISSRDYLGFYFLNNRVCAIEMEKDTIRAK